MSRIKGYIYLGLTIASICYRLYEKDMEGAILSLLVLPLCILYVNRPEGT
jgi:hypothetical protein